MGVIGAVRSWLKSTESVQWIEGVRQDPKRFIEWLEYRNKFVARAALNAASEVVDPQLLGMGALVCSLSDECVEVSLPFRWKNRPLGGAMDTGGLVTLSEFATRLLWSRHFDDGTTSIEVEKIEIRILKTIREKVWCRIHLNPQERDRCLYRLYSEGESRVSQEVSFFNADQLLVAQVSQTLDLKGVRALPAAGSAEE